MKEFAQINVYKNSRDILKRLAKNNDKSIVEIIDLLVRFAKKNPSILFAQSEEDLSDFSNDVIKQVTDKLKKFIRSETNRNIGFIKTQDEFLRRFRKDLLFKINPEHEQEFHPLFEDYDFYIGLIEKILEKRGITDREIKDDILQIYGKEKLNFFIESEIKIREKTLHT